MNTITVEGNVVGSPTCRAHARLYYFVSSLLPLATLAGLISLSLVFLSS